MSFGLANAGSVYSRILNVAMKEVNRDFWTSYLDDILTFRGSFGHTSDIWPRYKIQPSKTKLFQSEVEYLGHKISKGGVSLIPEYVQKIKDWPVL